jgi:hypothetical protein
MMDQYKHRYLPILTFSDRLSSVSTYPEGCYQRLTFETAVRHGATFGMERKRERAGLEVAWTK